MKRNRKVLYRSLVLLVTSFLLVCVVTPLSVMAFTATPARVGTVGMINATTGEGIPYGYQRSTFWDTAYGYHYVTGTVGNALGYFSSDKGESFASLPNDYIEDACSGSKNYSIWYDRDCGPMVHIVTVNSDVPDTSSCVLYGAATPNSSGYLEAVPKDEQLVYQAYADHFLLEPSVAVNASAGPAGLVVIVWTDRDESILAQPWQSYTVWNAVGTFNESGYWEQLVEPSDELTNGLGNNSRYISIVPLANGDFYAIHGENMSASEDEAYWLVGNRFDSGTLSWGSDEWIMDWAGENQLVAGDWYSLAAEVDNSYLHVVYTQASTGEMGPCNTSHDWAEWDGEDWGVNRINITQPGQIIHPALSVLNNAQMRLTYGNHSGEVGTLNYMTYTLGGDWDTTTWVEDVDWESEDLTAAYRGDSPLGFSWLDVGAGDFTLWYDYYGTDDDDIPGILGKELLQLILPLLMEIIALLAILSYATRLSVEPKVVITVSLLASALIGAIAFLVVKMIVGGL